MLQIKKTAVGILLSVVLTCVLLAGASLLVLRSGSLPGKWCGMISTIVGGVSVLTASIITAKIAGEKGMIQGIVISAVYAALFCAAVFIGTKSADVLPILLRAAAFLLCGAVGGVAGVGQKAKIKF